MVNVLGAVGMFVLTLSAYAVFHSVIAVALCSTLTLTAWTYIAEIYLNKKMNAKIDFGIISTQIVIMFLFVATANFNNLYIFIVAYPIIVMVYAVMNKNQIGDMMRLLLRK
jgi:hypothetical protein